MKNSPWIVATVLVAVAIAALSISTSAWRRAKRIEPRAAEPVANLLDPRNLAITTNSEAKGRVDGVFPNGVATEDAHTEIGTAEPPPRNAAPDSNRGWVAEIVLPAGRTAESVRSTLPTSDAARIERWVRGHVVGSELWLNVAKANAEERFDRIAVIVDLVDLDKAITATDVDRHLAWARLVSTRLGAGTVSTSMTSAEAVTKAQAAVALRKRFSDEDLDVGVYVAVPGAKLFPGKLVWDVVYSAGFTWGDGDYFHWVPSPETDVGQGISMNTSTGTGYFLPESLLSDDGTGDVGSLAMSFNVARTWRPMQVLDVMFRAAGYAARRLGGKVAASKDGAYLDERAARERVASIEKTFVASGVVPGSELALSVF